MCDICEKLRKGQKLVIPTRSTYAEDNFCDYINNSNCELCGKCGSEFNLSPYRIDSDSDIYGSVEFRREITDENGIKVIVHTFTESVKLNFCFNCGEKLL